jgi:hypothetical protein
MRRVAEAEVWGLLRLLFVWRQALFIHSGRLLLPWRRVTALSLFGLFSVTAMLVCYALEGRSPWFVLAFAVACWLGSAYGFMQGAWPFGLVEAVWGVVAVMRWRRVVPSR